MQNFRISDSGNGRTERSCRTVDIQLEGKATFPTERSATSLRLPKTSQRSSESGTAPHARARYDNALAALRTPEAHINYRPSLANGGTFNSKTSALFSECRRSGGDREASENVRSENNENTFLKMIQSCSNNRKKGMGATRMPGKPLNYGNTSIPNDHSLSRNRKVTSM